MSELSATSSAVRRTAAFLVAIAWMLCAAPPQHARATSTEPVTDPQVDPAPCVAAAAANDADRIIAICGALVDNDKTLKADRIKALIARAGAYDRKDLVDRAIGDYDTALRLDPTLADIFNIRGELWRKKGDRPRAGRFRRRDQTQSGSSCGEGQLQIAGAGTGAHRCADGGQQQAELQLRHRQTHG